MAKDRGNGSFVKHDLIILCLQKAYAEFRVGTTFREMRRELGIEQECVRAKQGRYMFVTRRTVLGRLRERKLDAWKISGIEKKIKRLRRNELIRLLQSGNGRIINELTN